MHPMLQRCIDWLMRDIRAKRALKRAKAITGQRPERAALQELFTYLRPELFTAYKVHSGASTRMAVWTPNIDAYTSKLKEATALVAREQAVRPTWVGDAPHRDVSVDRFLESHDGYYVDQFKAVSEFRSAVLALCHALQPSDHLQYGVYEHNLRMLTRLLVNLRAVGIALMEVSYQN